MAPVITPKEGHSREPYVDDIPELAIGLPYFTSLPHSEQSVKKNPQLNISPAANSELKAILLGPTLDDPEFLCGSCSVMLSTSLIDCF